MAMHRIVDAVDDWLDEHVHEHHEDDRFPARRRRTRERARISRARDELRQAAAGVLFLRNKLDAEQTERRVRLARACHAILRAVRQDDDETARPLLAYRDVLRERIQEAEEELAGLRTQVADAKSGLARLTRAVARMERDEQRESDRVSRAGPRRHRRGR